MVRVDLTRSLTWSLSFCDVAEMSAKSMRWPTSSRRSSECLCTCWASVTVWVGTVNWCQMALSLRSFVKQPSASNVESEIQVFLGTRLFGGAVAWAVSCMSCCRCDIWSWGGVVLGG
eukprot:6464525-Amphidinium_carterae.3